MISKSQQGFRDLIDSFDDVLLALSLDGEIRAANRSFADFVGQPFQEIIGLPLSTFCLRRARHLRRRAANRPCVAFWNGASGPASSKFA